MVVGDKSCCRPEELASSTLVDKLLDLHKLRYCERKAVAWAQNLKCLKIDFGSSDQLQLVEKPKEGSAYGEYVAVSYSWVHTPGHESNEQGKYCIVGQQGEQLRQSKVRDQILGRVVRYARHRRTPWIWIDKECIPQHDCPERQIAVNSMDLVYRNSRFPVGLLSLILEDQREIEQIEGLLQGKFINRKDEDEYPQLTYPADGSVSMSVLMLLQLLASDRWWTRAWIFQAEYVSSIDMYLLIRCRPGTKANSNVGVIPGELCIAATRFREQATLFLLAFKSETCSKLNKKCARLLKKFGKYSLLYRFQRDMRGKAMAPRIFADVHRRNMERRSDLLAIVANSCDYGVRLSPTRMLARGHSIGVCALAMFLLNGEIVRASENIKKLPTVMDLSNYLQYISFNGFDPPVGEKQLSYLKRCRLRPVTFERRGIVTEGHLWETTDIVYTDRWTIPAKWWRKRDSACGLNNFQRDCLYKLAQMLKQRRRHASLGEEIDNYLDRDAYSTEASPAKEYMDIMAETVVEAIRRHTPLHIVQRKGAAYAGGAFVGSRINSQMEAFTSWSDIIESDGRRRQSQVSLEVKVEQHSGFTFLSAVRWINGLVFFSRHERGSVTFKWPAAWSRVVPA